VKPPVSIVSFENAPKLLEAGALAQTPLGKLIVLSRPVAEL